MKKIILTILTRSGSFLRWKWLTLAAGVLLLAGSQSCRAKVAKSCYQMPAPDTNKVVQPDCYKMPVQYGNPDEKDSVISE